MTNEQTALLLRHLVERLNTAIEETETALDGSVPRPMMTVHIEPTCTKLVCHDPAHFGEQENPQGGRDELSSLYGLVMALEADAERLHPSP